MNNLFSQDDMNLSVNFDYIICINTLIDHLKKPLGFSENMLNTAEKVEFVNTCLVIDSLIKISKKKINFLKPSLLAVITIVSFAYTRKDAVKIIPIACLKD